MSLVKNEKGQFVKGANIKDLTGKRFGRLVVIGLSEKRVGRKTFRICQCDCGNIAEIRSDLLGRTNSCGCLKREQDIINLSIKNNHGLTNHPLYGRWNAIIQRCNNPKSHAFKNYGGRGIKVCDDWLDLRNFVNWAEANGFEKHLTIDRIDVNGDYKPANCRWIPMEEQHYNKTTSVFVEYEGEKLTVMQWAKRYDIPQSEVWGYKSKGIDFKDLIEKYR